MNQSIDKIKLTNEVATISDFIEKSLGEPIDLKLSPAINEHCAAKILGKSVQTLRNDRHKRRGCPYLKLGRSVRYRLKDLLEYLERHRIDPEV
jgi:hypothetical protein